MLNNRKRVQCRVSLECDQPITGITAIRGPPTIRARQVAEVIENN